MLTLYTGDQNIFNCQLFFFPFTSYGQYIDSLPIWIRREMSGTGSLQNHRILWHLVVRVLYSSVLLRNTWQYTETSPTGNRSYGKGDGVNKVSFGWIGRLSEGFRVVLLKKGGNTVVSTFQNNIHTGKKYKSINDLSLGSLVHSRNKWKYKV